MSGGGTVDQKLAPLFFQGTERLLLQPQSFTTRTDQFVAGWWPTPADRYIAKREQGHRFFGNNFICRHISLLHSGKKKGRHCQKKKLQRFFFFSKIFFWPESLIASPAQVKLVGAVRFQSAPIGFYDGREDTKKKVKCYLTRPMHRSYCTVCLLLAIFIFLARISPAKKLKADVPALRKIKNTRIVGCWNR